MFAALKAARENHQRVHMSAERPGPKWVLAVPNGTAQQLQTDSALLAASGREKVPPHPMPPQPLTPTLNSTLLALSRVSRSFSRYLSLPAPSLSIDDVCVCVCVRQVILDAAADGSSTMCPACGALGM